MIKRKDFEPWRPASGVFMATRGDFHCIEAMTGKKINRVMLARIVEYSIPDTAAFEANSMLQSVMDKVINEDER